MQVANILTIDVEDYFQVENFASVIDRSSWDSMEHRVVRNTEKVLQILDTYNTKATFFVLGWIAERYPELVTKIHKAGHEVASHGYAHRLIYSQTPDEFKSDIRKAKEILENIIQEPILGYRAPSYSITSKSLWAFDMLCIEGYKYDSSLFPIHHDRGGVPNAKTYPHEIKNTLWEYPLSTVKLLNQNIPFSGGGYFRLLPYAFIKGAIRQINKKGYPVIMYLHPWELDPDQPRIKAGRTERFRHYVNLRTTENKLRRLLGEFRFGTIRDERLLRPCGARNDDAYVRAFGGGAMTEL